MSSFTSLWTWSGVTRVNRLACWRAYCCSIEREGRAAFSLSRRSRISASERFFSSTIDSLPSRALQVLGKDDCLLDFPAEPDVKDVRAALLRHHGPREAVEPVVGPTLLERGIDFDRRFLSDLERPERARNRREPPSSGAAAELLPRLFHDPLRSLYHPPSSRVQDFQDVQLDHLARDPQGLREARRRAAPVPVDELLHVHARLRRDPQLRRRFPRPSHLNRRRDAFPDAIRTPMGYPGWCALGNRSADERRDGAFKLSIFDRRRELHVHPVRFRRAVLLQDGDLVARHDPEPFDLDLPRA